MSSNDPKADYDAALKLKIEGNEAFKKKDYKKALKSYSRMFMYLGMNPCMNLGALSGGDPSTAVKQNKNPLEQKTDELRLTAFNNIAAVYAKLNNWEDCKEKCSAVLKHDPKNKKALFRRAKAYRHCGLFDLARSDLKQLQEEMDDKQDKTIEKELKLLKIEEKKTEKEFLKSMQKAMNRQRKKQKKKENKKSKIKKNEKENKTIEINKKSNNSESNKSNKSNKNNTNNKSNNNIPNEELKPTEF